MQTTTRLSRLLVAGALALALTGPTPAYAVRVFDLASGSYLVPSWFESPSSPAGGTVVTEDPGDPTNFEIRVGAAEFGSREGDFQTPAIYGAGALLPANGGAGYRVEFATEVFGWDSYNGTVPVPGSRGYWDVFAVNLNQGSAYYWDQVDGGSGALPDPILDVDPAGGCIMTGGGGGDPCTAAAGGAGFLAGETWAWGAADFGNGTFESNAGTYSLTLAGLPGNAYFLSVVLDTATFPDADDQFPSFGSFNPLSPVPPPVPEPGLPWLLGPSLLVLRFAAGRGAHSV